MSHHHHCRIRYGGQNILGRLGHCWGSRTVFRPVSYEYPINGDNPPNSAEVVSGSISKLLAKPLHLTHVRAETLPVGSREIRISSHCEGVHTSRSASQTQTNVPSRLAWTHSIGKRPLHSRSEDGPTGEGKHCLFFILPLAHWCRRSCMFQPPTVSFCVPPMKQDEQIMFHIDVGTVVRCREEGKDERDVYLRASDTEIISIDPEQHRSLFICVHPPSCPAMTRLFAPPLLSPPTTCHATFTSSN